MCGNRRRKTGGNITVNPAKYKSVSMTIGNWELASKLSNLIVPNVTLSKSKVV